MNVQKFTMEPGEAREKLAEVRDAMRANASLAADKEYEQLERAYNQIAKGRALINLRDAITTAPTFDNGLPRLAVARADQRQVHADRGYSTLTFRSGHWRSRERSLRFEFSGLPRVERVTAEALVPMIPPAVRKIAGWRRSLEKMFVLWEVEEWRLVPPVDPYLVAHVCGDLYAVLAAWDLTPIERAVMAGRALA